MEVGENRTSDSGLNLSLLPAVAALSNVMRVAWHNHPGDPCHGFLR